MYFKYISYNLHILHSFPKQGDHLPLDSVDGVAEFPSLVRQSFSAP